MGSCRRHSVIHAAKAGAVACSAPPFGASSAVQRHGMITQKGPDGSEAMPGLIPSMRRRVELAALSPRHGPFMGEKTAGDVISRAETGGFYL